MKSMNKVQLIGYLGRDPEIRRLPGGTWMAVMRLATHHWLNGQSGELKKFTSWHVVKVWGEQQVERLRNYLIKGSHILVDGRIVYRTYQDRVGHTRYITEIRANYLVDLDR